MRFDDAESGKPLAGPFAATLGDVGLSALDLVFLAPVGEDTGLGRLGDVLAAWGEGMRPESVPATAVLILVTGQGDPSTDDLALACRALRRLIAEARDLDGRDVASPGALEVPSGLDVGELEARIECLRAGLAAAREALAAALPARPDRPARGDVRGAMLALAGFELPGGVSKASDPATLAAEGEALVAQIDARLAELDARETAEKADWALRDDAGKVELLRGRVHLLIGHAMPVTPLFAAANGAELDTSFARPRLGTREDATGWLAAAGRADPGARRLRIAVDLVEAARNDTLFDFALGQLPDHEEEDWAAVARPARDERGRLCLLATGPGPRFEGGPAAGLVLGTWTEAIPRSGQTAGVAFHFDAPSARPPQAVLLCTAKDEAGFDAGDVADMLRQTLELAQLRMVGPETLQGLGQYLPAAYLSGDTDPGGSAVAARSPNGGRDDLAAPRGGDGRPRPVRGPGGPHRRPAMAARPAVAGRRVQGRGRREPDLRRDDAQPRPDHARPARRPRRRRPGDRARRRRGPARDRGRARARPDRPGRRPARRRGRPSALPLPRHGQGARWAERGHPQAVSAQARRRRRPRPGRAGAAGAARPPLPRSAPAPRGADRARRQGSGGPSGDEGCCGAKALDDWADWYAQLYSEPAAGAEAWNPQRMEYRFQIAAGISDKREVQLDAVEYTGGHLDWHAFDVAAEPKDMGARGELVEHDIRVIPTPARFAGQAASRWWQMENATVWFGDLQAAPADLARAAVASFGLTFGDDWFLAPCRLPSGVLVRSAPITVIDTFEETHEIRSCAELDGPGREWRFFELTGDKSPLCPWLLLPPALAGRTESPPVEDVALLRDEVANLGWGAELRIESAAGRVIDRAARARAAMPPAPTPADDAWLYKLTKAVPEHQVPLVPVARTARTASGAISSAAGSRCRLTRRVSRRAARSAASSSRTPRC